MSYQAQLLEALSAMTKEELIQYILNMEAM